jgi:hypothetical protein
LEKLPYWDQWHHMLGTPHQRLLWHFSATWERKDTTWIIITTWYHCTFSSSLIHILTHLLLYRIAFFNRGTTRFCQVS